MPLKVHSSKYYRLLLLPIFLFGALFASDSDQVTLSLYNSKNRRLVNFTVNKNEELGHVKQTLLKRFKSKYITQAENKKKGDPDISFLRSLKNQNPLDDSYKLTKNESLYLKHEDMIMIFRQKGESTLMCFSKVHPTLFKNLKEATTSEAFIEKIKKLGFQKEIEGRDPHVLQPGSSYLYSPIKTIATNNDMTVRVHFVTKRSIQIEFTNNEKEVVVQPLRLLLYKENWEEIETQLKAEFEDEEDEDDIEKAFQLDEGEHFYFTHNGQYVKSVETFKTKTNFTLHKGKWLLFLQREKQEIPVVCTKASNSRYKKLQLIKKELEEKKIDAKDVVLTFVPKKNQEELFNYDSMQRYYEAYPHSLTLQLRTPQYMKQKKFKNFYTLEQLLSLFIFDVGGEKIEIIFQPKAIDTNNIKDLLSLLKEHPTIKQKLTQKKQLFFKQKEKPFYTNQNALIKALNEKRSVIVEIAEKVATIQFFSEKTKNEKKITIKIGKDETVKNIKGLDFEVAKIIKKEGLNPTQFCYSSKINPKLNTFNVSISPATRETNLSSHHKRSKSKIIPLLKNKSSPL